MFRVDDDAPHRLFGRHEQEFKGLDEVRVDFVPPFDEDELVAEEEKKLRVRFELRNTDPAIANALRRIMIAEVETVAVDQIGMMQNTSIIPDEVLVHRVAMVPLAVDPRHVRKGEALFFELTITCKGKPQNVYSRDLLFQPDESQTAAFPDQKEYWSKFNPRPVHSDILLAKLLPGQQIHLRAVCTVGKGQDHAKWSPVATATYRIMPKVDVNTARANGELAQAIKQACPRDVFDIEDSGALVATDPRRCTMCRECVRLDEFKGCVELYRVSDHFIFSVESVGSLPPLEIVRRAILVLKAKAVAWKRHLHSLQATS
ncbi:DNA-directed RNA polymerases I and III subunit rpac1 [Hondaea fermentalgiana]|uniref:DNA-directed RNA polymerases I and III subunit rpac1 n=1 Tax=Hondaea fermentalgiana TaxID=2315210 RepID=A0A2R5FZ54_9STRA|nr:DNA-directed RNA polymerases I and III subunit rpac1 [Hondaea fermentalgiana]|eukprot:GBG24032.1 DNA-directed RNA polymerases I and III subunit rpac1 [Hondaea fermentalgiana]